MIDEPGGAPRLRVVTREIDAIEDVLTHTPPDRPVFWGRRGSAMAVYGESTGFVASAGTPVEAASAWWREVVAAAEVDDPVGLPGTGLIAFGSFAFDAASGRGSLLSVPWMVVGRRDGRSWVTHITHARGSDRPDNDRTPDGALALPPAVGFGPHWSATLRPGTLGAEDYRSAVARALRAVDDGTVEKVVVARDLRGSVPVGSDLRRLVRALSSGYPDTWTFAFDGLIGASPETLVTVSDGTVTARVLAGTAPRGADADADTAASVALTTSAKDLDEHQYAVQSVLATLQPHTTALAAAETPFALKLPNLWHLATDVEGALASGASALDLALTLHPTAAVAGTPRDVACDLIRDLEPFDRGRYAGPVGWVDAAGDGEWAIALRCAQFDIDAVPPDGADDVPLTAYAGAGIVAGSDPDAELLETRVKFRPIVDALA